MGVLELIEVTNPKLIKLPLSIAEKLNLRKGSKLVLYERGNELLLKRLENRKGIFAEDKIEKNWSIRFDNLLARVRARAMESSITDADIEEAIKEVRKARHD
ncbi:hypothetical protein KKE26_01125 [bacterium]|nr:hypothetical protein [bacterium]MBU1753196.1 hypothetical protein [bacterium]